MGSFEITDQMGRMIQITKPVSRIVCLNPSQTETLVDLGLEESLVGITKFCIYPDYLRKTKTVVGGTKNINYDKIKSLKPDIILCNKEENSKEIVEALEKEYPVHVTDVGYLTEALEMIRQYGQLFDCTEKASELCTHILAEKLEFESIISTASKYRVAYFIWQNPWMVVGKGTFIDHMLALNGYSNAFAEQDRYPVIELDTLKNKALDYILLSSEPFPFNEEHKLKLEQQLGIPVKLVNGEFFSWYGSRLLRAFDYFKSLHGH